LREINRSLRIVLTLIIVILLSVNSGVPRTVASEINPATPASIVVDGQISDWNQLPTIATGNGPVTELYSTQQDNTLYLLIRGTNMGVNHDFYLDTDSNLSTGWRNMTWKNCGADYLIENSRLFQWTNGAWEFKGIVDMVKTDTSVEFGVELDRLGKTAPGEIGIGYSMDNGLFLPRSGNYVAGISRPAPPPGTILVDGKTSDWNVLPTIATGNGTVKELYSKQQNDKLFLMIKGTGIGKYNDFYLDTDRNAQTGWKNLTWANCGADYLIENDNLYEWVKSSWEYRGVIDLASTDTALEIGVGLERLGKTEPGEIGIGYNKDNEEFLPSSGNYLAGITIPTIPPVPGTLVVDGIITDWNPLPTIATGSGLVQELYSKKQNQKLFLMVKGTRVGKYNDFYIDSDRNPETGWKNMTWKNCGADYLIENGNLFQWVKGSWAYSGTVDMTKTEKTLEIGVELSRLGDTAEDIGIGYTMDNQEFLPSQGNYIAGIPIPGSPVAPGSIFVDGEPSDWNSLPLLATGTGSVKELYSKQMSQKLFLMIKGTNIGRYNDFYLDVDNDTSTGWRNWTWGNCGADYLIEDGNLFQWVNGSWEFKGTLEMASSSTCMEVGVELSRIGKTTSGDIGIGYSKGNLEFLPLNGGNVGFTTAAPHVMSASLTVDGKMYVAYAGAEAWMVDLSALPDKASLTDFRIVADPDAKQATMKIGLDENTGISKTVTFYNGVANVNVKEILGSLDQGVPGISIGKLRLLNITHFSADLVDTNNKHTTVNITVKLR
jgi:hypothetical protein